LCLGAVFSYPKVEAKISQEPRLRKIISPGTLGYIRIPNLWGFLSDPKGNTLDDVLKNEEHARLITSTKKSMNEKIKGLDPSPVSIRKCRMGTIQ
jgi:hypothetical protein